MNFFFLSHSFISLFRRFQNRRMKLKKELRAVKEINEQVTISKREKRE